MYKVLTSSAQSDARVGSKGWKRLQLISQAVREDRHFETRKEDCAL